MGTGGRQNFVHYKRMIYLGCFNLKRSVRRIRTFRDAALAPKRKM